MASFGANSLHCQAACVRIKRNEELTTISEKAIFNSDLTFFKIIGNSQVKLFTKEGQKHQEINLFNTKENK